MDKYVVSPMTEVPFMYEDDKLFEEYEGTDVEVICEADFADEQAFSHENMKLDTPHPPLSLLNEDPLEYVKEFMFLTRPARLRECDWEFWCLHWQPITFRILEICTEYCSQRNVDLMNENAELERAHKNLGPRRTTVLTREVYEAQTIERTRNPPKGEKPWDRDDHIWCICEGVKLFPKNLAKNQRFKRLLGLPVPGRDYEVVRGVVRNELDKLHNMPAPAPSVVKKKKAPAAATKVGGVRRKAARTKTRTAPASDDEDDADYNDKVATLASSHRSPFVKASGGPAIVASSSGGARNNNNNKRSANTSKRAIKERPSEDEFVLSHASPKKKAKAANRKKSQVVQDDPFKFAVGNKDPVRSAAATAASTPARGGGRTRPTRFTAAEESKLPKGHAVTVKGEDDVVRTVLGSPIHFQDPATFAPDSDDDFPMRPDEDGVEVFEDVEMLNLAVARFEHRSDHESDGSDKTITGDSYKRNVDGA
ncbi:hypothetical protein SLS58_009795 [Diplodia intermedia]|uniref:Uncharacterized protein n=1 Tax=Diplodia intermedia TaxID=856260 RepID=A0ABR3TAQ4_9PEZI